MIAGPFSGDQMTEWQAAGYFTGSNVYIWKYVPEAAPVASAAAPTAAPVAAVPSGPLPDSPATGGVMVMRGRKGKQEDRSVAINDLHSVMYQPTSQSLGGSAAALYCVVSPQPQQLRS